MSRFEHIRRLAHLLYDLAEQEGRFDDLERELQVWAELLEASSEVCSASCSPALPLDRRAELLMDLRSAIAKQGVPVTRTVLPFLAALAREGELHLLPQVRKVFEDLLDRRLDRARVRIRSARPLTPQQRTRIKEALADRFSGGVVIEHEVDSSLLGGVAAQVNDFSFDGTLRGQLDRLRRRLEAQVRSMSDPAPAPK